MRQLKGLSPTSLHLWESDRDEFYLKYLADYKRPNPGQTDAMSVGSAFDAYVKAALHWGVYGHDANGEFTEENLLRVQVDPVCLPFARRAGDYCFKCYVRSGCFHELLRDLQASEVDPRFEFTLNGEAGGVPLTGKPDCWWKRGVQKTLDWKVEGYCSAYPTSPRKLYKACRDTWEPTELIKATRGGGQPKPHKDYSEIDHYGNKIGAHWLEEVEKKWADQIAIYSWMLGMSVGDEETITCIDQLACKPNPLQETTEERLFPLIRVAQHRCRISGEWQRALLERLQSCWLAIQSGYIFDDVSEDESKQRCEMLDMQKPLDPDDENTELWETVNERQYRG